MNELFTKKSYFCTNCTKNVMKIWGFTLFKFCDKFGTILKYNSVVVKKDLY